jgi:hypothetical protein
MSLPCGAVGGTEELGGRLWELVLVTMSWGCISLPVFVCGKDEAVQFHRVYYHVPAPMFTPSTQTWHCHWRWTAETGILLSRNSRWTYRNACIARSSISRLIPPLILF